MSPTFNCPPIPTPPATVRAPVVVLVDGVGSVILKGPAKVVLPAILTSPPIVVFFLLCLHLRG